MVTRGSGERIGIAIIMDGKEAWRDNVLVERLWRTIKYEDVDLRAYASVCEARASLGSVGNPRGMESAMLLAYTLVVQSGSHDGGVFLGVVRRENGLDPEQRDFAQLQFRWPVLVEFFGFVRNDVGDATQAGLR